LAAKRRQQAPQCALAGARGACVTGFVERNGLWSDSQREAARRVESQIVEQDLQSVRFAFADQHGIVRGKTLVANAAIAALKSGVGMVGTILLKDTAGRNIYPVFGQTGGFVPTEFHGAADVVLVAYPATFKILPWVEKTGWLLCDAYFADGRPVPFDTRRICRDALARLDSAGFEYLAGLEVEFYVFKLENPRLSPQDSGWPGTPPEVSLLNTGYHLLTEQRYDQLEPVLELLRRDLTALGLPLRSMEIELGPSQCEFVFDPAVGLAAADMMILFRNAAKQILRRHGYHASFMCRPRIPNVMSSGWHLHQSLRRKADGLNAFMPLAAAGGARRPIDSQLSAPGQHFLAGLLAHARGASAFTTPTINGYRRFRPHSLAPDRAVWGHDNRGAMVRVIGGMAGELPDSGTRLENRAGEPAANPYLYFAAQIAAGIDGIERQLDPGPGAGVPYEAAAAMLPRSLPEALAALLEDPCLCAAFGPGFIDYFVRIKRAEIARFDAEVTDWEHREYFDLF
jgi:glutamine synthetase